MRKKNHLEGVVTIALASLLMSYGDSHAERARLSSLDIPTNAEGPRRLVASTDLITLREIGGMIGTGLGVSPDGRYLAFEAHQADIDENDYGVAWFVASITSESIPVNVGDGGDPTLFKISSGGWIAEYPRWSPDSNGIAYRKRVNGETQVWWSSRDGTETKQLTNNAADVEELYWSGDGSRLYFTTDADRARLSELENSRYRNGHVYDYEKHWTTIDGKPVYPAYSLTGGEARVWIFDIESRLERLATDDERVEYERLKQPDARSGKYPGARHIAWTEDKSRIAWLQPDDPEKQGRHPPLTLYASAFGDGSDPVRCPATECTGILDYYSSLRAILHWDAVGDEIFFVRNEGTAYAKRTLYGWRVGEKQARKIFTTDNWLSDCSIVRDRAVCFLETPTYPRTIVAIDLSDGSMRTLVDPNPEFRNVTLGDVELLEWENSHGYRTFGYLVKPPDYVHGRRYPLVFVGYRARWALRGGVGEEYPVHVFAANDFFVLAYEKPTTYGAEEIYSDPLDIAKAMWGPDLFDVRMPLASFEAAIGVLSDRGLVDPRRVAVTGLSNGVGHVNYALIHSDLFAAAITSSIAFGPSGRALIGGAGELFREYLRVIGAGPYPGPHAFIYPHLSMSLNAEQIDAPLLVNVSDKEHPWALQEVVALIENEKPVEMVVYPDERHIKWQPAHRLSVYERNVDWLNFWLQDVEDSSPEKTDQYARWRLLRDKHAKREAESTTVERTN